MNPIVENILVFYCREYKYSRVCRKGGEAVEYANHFGSARFNPESVHQFATVIEAEWVQGFGR